MPRTLPWLRAQDDTSVKRESTPRKRIKTEVTPDRDVTPKNLPLSPDKRDFFRSCTFNSRHSYMLCSNVRYLSTAQTPPSSPIKRCPSEEYDRKHTPLNRVSR
jgi:hypothetical protein